MLLKRNDERKKVVATFIDRETTPNKIFPLSTPKSEAKLIMIYLQLFCEKA